MYLLFIAKFTKLVFYFNCTLQKEKFDENLQNNLYLESWAAFSIETLYTVSKSCYAPEFQNHEKIGDCLGNLTNFLQSAGQKIQAIKEIKYSNFVCCGTTYSCLHSHGILL